MIRYSLYQADLDRFVTRLVSRYSISRLAASTLIEQYLDLLVQAEPELWNDETCAFTPEGRLDALARLNFYTDPVTETLLAAQTPLLNAISTAAIMAQEFDRARDELVRVAMLNKGIDRGEIAAMAGIKKARLYQIDGVRPPTPAPLDMPKYLLHGASIDDAAPIGNDAAGETVRILLRHLRGAVVGMRGGGKTTFLHLLTLLLGRCADSMVWHLDINNGGLSSLWLLEYALGNVAEPFVDWPASTLDEAVTMLEAAAALIEIRKRTRGIHRGDPTPQVTIIADELGELSSDDKRARKARSLIHSIAREDPTLGVTIVGSALRATTDVMPPALSERDTTLRVASRVRDNAELALLFRNYVQLATETLDRGTLAVETPDMPGQPVLTYLMQPNDIRAATRALQQARASSRFGALELEQLGSAYTGRWEHPDVARMLKVLAAGDDEDKIRAALA